MPFADDPDNKIPPGVDRKAPPDRKVPVVQPWEQPGAPPPSWASNVGNYSTPGYQGINWGNYLNQFGSFFKNAASQRSPQEIQALQQLTSLSQTFGGGAEGYQKALDYYGKIVGGNKTAAMEAAAPQMEQNAEIYGGAQRGLDATAGVNAGARASAEADLARSKAGAISGVLERERPDAAKELGNLAVAGGGISEKAASDAAQLEQARTLSAMQLTAQLAGTAAQVEMNGRLGFASLNLDAAKSSDAAKMQMYFGGRAADLADKNFSLQSQAQTWMQNTYFPWYQGQAAQQLDAQKQAGKEQMFGNVLGMGASFIPHPGH